MKDIVYIISQVEKSLSFEWLVTRLAREYRLTVILLNPSPSPFESFLQAHRIAVRRIMYRSKSDFPVAFLRVFLHIMRTRPDVVHAHLFDAQLVGLGSSWLAGIRKRVYTRHNSTFHHTYHRKGVRYDRLSNWLATNIVSVSQATDHALIDLEGVRPGKLVKIPHGFEFEAFLNVSDDRVSSLRGKWSVLPHHPVIGVVSRLIQWKGVEYILKAFSGFQKRYPGSSLVLANATGPELPIVKRLVEDLAIKNVVLIAFEDDAPALYRVFDMVVHVPVDPFCEAFGQVYIEAMASRIPMVVTRSGIAAEFVQDRVHAMVVPYRDAEAITRCLVELWNNEELRTFLAGNANPYVVSHFGIDAMVSGLKQLYDD